MNRTVQKALANIKEDLEMFTDEHGTITVSRRDLETIVHYVETQKEKQGD